jgi:VIT1/CCC1 family predicted Fe2+/Mn2+ transporter
MTSLSSCIVAFVVSPSLSNFIASLIAGTIVLSAIGTAVALVSNNDRVTRR